MSWRETLTNEVEEKLTTKWDFRNGYVIPDSETVALTNGAVVVDAAFLYADLAGSSKLARLCPWETTAKIIRSYLNICVRLIKAYGGEVRSFDGDRVMGVFMGESKENKAVKCAREIDWCVNWLIRPKIKDKFPSIRKNDILLKHCVGVDSGEVRAVRAGTRNSSDSDNNDLIWIGRASSLAAKLSDIRDYPYEVYITDKVFEKIGGKEDIWEFECETIADSVEILYKTKYPLEP